MKQSKLPNFIELLRISRGLTQKQLAERLGIEQATVSEYERGNVDLPVSRLVSLANVLELPPEGFLRVAGHSKRGRQEKEGA